MSVTTVNFSKPSATETIDRYASEIHGWKPSTKYTTGAAYLKQVRMMRLREINSLLNGDSCVEDYTPDDVTPLQFILDTSACVLDITDVLKLNNT